MQIRWGSLWLETVDELEDAVRSRVRTYLAAEGLDSAQEADENGAYVMESALVAVPEAVAKRGDDAEISIVIAYGLLRHARALLMNADAPKAAERVRAALRSTQGALRNAENRPYRALRPPHT